jgi:hypothetical protein
MRMTFTAAAILAFCIVCHAERPKVPIFIGPQVRDGFVDVDAGLLDSVQDIQKAFRHSDAFTLASTPEQAVLTLIIADRRTPGQSGAVGVPIGAATLFLPIKRRAIDSILKVGSYERAITSETDDNDHWRAAARQVVKDVTAWLDANRSRLALQ